MSFLEIKIISCFSRNKFDKSLILCKPEVKMKVGTRRGGSKRERNEDVGASAPVVHCPHSRSLTPPPFPLPYSLHTEEFYVFVLPISNSSTIAFLFPFLKIRYYEIFRYKNGESFPPSFEILPFTKKNILSNLVCFFTCEDAAQ